MCPFKFLHVYTYHWPCYDTGPGPGSQEQKIFIISISPIYTRVTKLDPNRPPLLFPRSADDPPPTRRIQKPQPPEFLL